MYKTLTGQDIAESMKDVADLESIREMNDNYRDLDNVEMILCIVMVICVLGGVLSLFEGLLFT